MSLVGPRPPIAYEIENYQPWHLERLKAVPGLTGLWQVSGRSKVSFDDMVRLDVRYINNWSPWQDLTIMLKTIPVVLRGTGGLLAARPRGRRQGRVRPGRAEPRSAATTRRTPVERCRGGATARRPTPRRDIMMKIGVIGCGYWGPNLIRNFNGLPDAEVAAIADLDETRLRACGAALSGRPARPPTTGEIIEDPGDRRRGGGHADVHPLPAGHGRSWRPASTCSSRSPWPPTATTAGADRRRAKRDGCMLMVGHTFVYTPAVRKIKELMDAGELGEIYYVNITRVNLGIFQKDANVVWDLAPHDVAMLNYLFDADPVTVSATGRCYVQRDLGIEDVAFVTLEYPGGTPGPHPRQLAGSRTRSASAPSWAASKMLVYDDVSPSEKIRVYDKGVDVQPHYDSFGEFQLLYRSGDVFIPRLDTVEPLKAETEHFLDVIAGKAEPLSSGEHGLKVVQVLEGACRSIEGGRQAASRWIYDD